MVRRRGLRPAPARTVPERTAPERTAGARMLTAGRVALALVLGGLWCWAVLRLALAPGQAGVVEGFVAAGGWGISLLPVHAASPPPRRRPARRAFMATSAVRRRTNPWST